MFPRPAAGRSNPVATCQRQIEKLGEALVQKVMRAEHDCLARQSKGKLPPPTVCTGEGPSLARITDGKTRSAIEAAIVKARATIAGKCPGVDLLATPPNGLGFSADCPTLNGACDLAVDTSDGAVECYLCAHLAAAHYLTGVQRPASVAGAPLATPTPAPTPAIHATPFLVKEIYPGPNDGCCEHMVSTGALVFFVAADANGSRVWRSDGTPAGTIPLQPTWINPRDLTVVGDHVFFADYTKEGGGGQLWRTDGTPEGTHVVVDAHQCASNSPDHLTDVNGALYFLDCGDLWKSDGTVDGTVLVNDSYFFLGGFPEFAAVGSTLFFVAQDEANGGSGLELFKSNSAGTTLVRDITPGNESSAPDALIASNGTLFFTADDGLSGRELWRSDGTVDGTTLVKDIASGFGVGSIGTAFAHLVPYGDGVVFVANDGSTGEQLWRSSGTAMGTQRLTNVDYVTSTPFSPRRVGSLVYFAATNERGSEPWRTDGTPGGTARIADVRPGPVGSGPSEFTGVDGSVFFAADDGIHGTELWRTDGTEGGTYLTSDLRTGDAPSNPHRLINAGGTIFFVAIAGQDTGYELWAIQP